MSTLAWSYPDATTRAFVLSADGRQIGWLRFENETGACAAAEVDGVEWNFEATASAYPSVTIRRVVTGQPVAEFTPCPTGGGVVAFAGGARFCWTREHVWSPRWCFRCKEEKSTVCVSLEPGPLIGGGRVTVCADAADRAEMPVLVVLAWYLRVLDFERMAESIVVCD